jgi:hypothetical protein
MAINSAIQGVNPISVSTFFKTVGASSTFGKAHPELVGKKRDNLVFNYFPVTVDHLHDLSEADQAKVAKVLNANLEEYGKQLLAEKGDDWEYTPASSEITIDALYDDLMRPSNKGNRILSKAVLERLADLYRHYAVTNLGKSEKAAELGAKIIRTKFAMIAGENKVLQTFSDNIVNFTLLADTVPEIAELETELAALLAVITEMLGVEITADDI